MTEKHRMLKLLKDIQDMSLSELSSKRELVSVSNVNSNAKAVVLKEIDRLLNLKNHKSAIIVDGDYDADFY